MSTHTRPDSAMAAFTKPRRIHMACVNCRAGKTRCVSPDDGQPCARCTKRNLDCEYLTVPDEESRAGFVPDAGRRSRKRLPLPSAPAPHMATEWTQALQDSRASDTRSSPQPSQGFDTPPTASQFNSGLGVHAAMTLQNPYSSEAQYPAGEEYIAYKDGGPANQSPRPQLTHPASRLPNQPPALPPSRTLQKHIQDVERVYQALHAAVA
ncbi:hypothetical protein FB451DRAFT_1178016 [Mycena latifolia]|nr:hypothetical protein FB451DRAFT_1178016 [Mycena latifolia]